MAGRCGFKSRSAPPFLTHHPSDIRLSLMRLALPMVKALSRSVALWRSPALHSANICRFGCGRIRCARRQVTGANDASGDQVEFDVLGLGKTAQHGVGLVGVDVILLHEDALGHTDVKLHLIA